MRRAFVAAFVFVSACSSPEAERPGPAAPPNFDALAGTPVGARSFDRALAETLAKRGSPIHVESRLGVPSFVWAGAQGDLSRAASAGDAARAHLERYAPLYGIDARDPVLVRVEDRGRGPVIADFRQRVAGVEVFRESLKVVMNRNREVVALSGYLTDAAKGLEKAGGPVFSLDAPSALAFAIRDLRGEEIDTARVNAVEANGEFERFELLSSGVPGSELVEPARARKVLYHAAQRLVPAWYVEVASAVDEVDSLHYAYVISAEDGALLFRKNLVESDSFTYRVWAHPTDYVPYDGPQGNDPTPNPSGLNDGYQAPFVASNLITLDNAPFSRGDDWLFSGATETNGNNVDAYADVWWPDGFTDGDLRAVLGTSGAFDYPMDFAQQPKATSAQQMAAITQLFWNVNWMHDWHYDAGFDEASGNAQLFNYGRGGIAGDPIRAEAQDFSGRNNANMSTPADGGRPRMQMYLFDGYPDPADPAKIVMISPSPATITDVGTDTFGPSVFDLQNEQVVRAIPNDACGALTNGAQIAGTIAFVDRGSCGFHVKALNAEAAGAVGVIIGNVSTSPDPTVAPFMTGSFELPRTLIGALSVNLATGDDFRTNLAAGTVTVDLYRRVPDRDGAIDNLVVAHEWGHYISNRLIGDASGLSSQLSRGLGEGWGDFHALLMSVRPEDAAVASNTNFNGVYALAGFVAPAFSSDPYYFGLRRYPYSTDFAKNPLTYQHIADANPLPGGAPLEDNGVENSEVHNAGEIWATMLWECYAALLRDTLGATPRLTFDEAQTRMRDYLVAAYKMTPNDPTLLEARDALLLAAYVGDSTDHGLFVQAFATRGAGMGAGDVPDRFTSTNDGVVESFSTGNALALEAIALEDSVSGPCGADGALDDGETGSLTVTVRNVGAGDLANVTVSVTTTNAGVTFPMGSAAMIPAIAPYSSGTVTLDVAASGLTDITTLGFDVTASATSANTAVLSATVLGNFDDIAAQSSTDTVEPALTPWTADGGWARAEISASSHEWRGPDIGAISDVTLTSPELLIAPSGTFSFSFSHAYQFETNFDGGVIEITSDGGATWTDIGAEAMTPATYSTEILFFGGGNPLEGRRSFTGTSARSTVTANLGSAYNGRIVQIRFRIGTDLGVGGSGWQIDDLAFTNLLEDPFPVRVAHDVTCHQPPTAYAGVDRGVDERMVVAFDGTGASASGLPLTYRWQQVSGPPQALVGEDTTTLFVTPDGVADPGELLTFSFTTFDGTYRSAPSAVNVFVANVNRAPSVDAGGDFGGEERSTIQLGATANDADGDALTFEWTQTAGSPVVTLSGASTANPSFTAPEVTSATDLTFQVSVTDGLAGAVTDTVVVTVSHTNLPPVANAGADLIADERTSIMLDAGASADPDAGAALTYAWTQTAGPTTVALSSSSSATPTFTVEVIDDSTFTFSVAVSDGSLASTDTVDVLVRQVNAAPVASAGPDQPSIAEASTVTLNGSGSSDPDADALSYAWTQTSGTPVALTGAATSMPEFVAPEVPNGSPATLVFSLVVNDGTFTSTADSVSVTVVHENKAPEAIAEAVTSAAERSTVTLDGSGSTDPDGDNLTWTWTQTSGPTATLSGSGSDRTFVAPDVAADDTVVFELVVSDGALSSAPSAVSIVVEHVNRAPIADAGEDASLDEKDTLVLMGSGSDPDGDVLTFAWVQTSGPAAALADADSATASLTAPAVGETTVLELQLVVTDAAGLSSAPASVSITVSPVSGGGGSGGGGGGCAVGGTGQRAPAGMFLAALAMMLVRRRRPTAR